MGSAVLPTLRERREVDAAIRDTLDKVLVLRFGRAVDAACLHLDDVSHDTSPALNIHRAATPTHTPASTAQTGVAVSGSEVAVSLGATTLHPSRRSRPRRRRRKPRAMGEPSKELLDIPSEPKPPHFIESLFASRECNKEGKRKAGPPTDPLPKSQVLGKVKDFLGVMAKANEKLQLDAQNKPLEEYDIETLTGNEKEYIEMDLLLGVADLHSEKAVDAAEATMSGFQPSGRAFACSSSSSEDDSDDSDEDSGDEPDMSSKDKGKDPNEPETHPSKGKKPNKRQKIVVLN